MRTFLALIGLLFSLPAGAADDSGRAKIIDGDTIEISGQRIDLYGIDAPELKQLCRTGRHGKAFECGIRAARALRDLIGREEIACRRVVPENTAPPAAKCAIGRIDLNEQMVLQGWALAARQASSDYVRAEEAARRVREGLWRHTFETPWDWRRENPE